MTDKEKMTEIIQKVLTRDVNTIERKAKRMTNALIGAGFVSDETRHKRNVQAQELIKGIEYVRVHEVNARNYAFHRAEVAERALLLACANLVKDEKDNVDIELLARVLYTKFLRKAEKELAEDGKDD